MIWEQVLINLMLLFIFRRLGLGEARPTTVTLQLADRSLKHPRKGGRGGGGGVIEDVLVKVDKFIFLTYFIVLDMEEDKEIPIILGRPFQATSGALIDVQTGELKLRALEDKITFHVFRPMKPPDDYPNKDTSVLNPKEILQGEVVNSRDKSRVAQRITQKIKGMVTKIVQPL